MIKRFIILVCLLSLVGVCHGALSNPASDINWGSSRTYSNYVDNPLRLWVEEVDSALAGSGSTGFNNILMEPTTQPTSTEGRFYYDTATKALRLYNGTSWEDLDTAGSGSLDLAYNVGSSITVDQDPIALTVGSSDNNSALTIAFGETSNNNDAFTIAHQGSGDAIQVTIVDTDGVAANFIAASAQTTSLVKFDSATNNWDGADDVGMVHISDDTALIHAGASLLTVTHATAQPITGAEGFLARFISTGTARTNAHAVEIETTNTQPTLMLNNRLTITGADNATTLMAITGNDTSGNSDTVTINHDGTGSGLKITADGVTSVALETVSAASQTTSLAIFDGSAGNWIGANDVGMLHVQGDTAHANAGASMLNVNYSATPISAAEGFLARFVHSGSAQTNSSAVEIEVPATQPALAINGIVAISGQDNPGVVLFQVTGIDTTSDRDTMSIDSSGAGNALYIDQNEADSQGITLEPFTNSVVASLEIDGDAAGWLGANDVGMLHLRNDIPQTNTGSTMFLVDNTGQPIASAEGFLARFVDVSTARTDAYAVEIEVTNTTPALFLNGQMTITGADLAGILFDITGNDTSGNSDTMTINHDGTGDGLAITCDGTTSVAANFVAATSQTTSLVTFDGTTGAWLGAQNVGMIHVTNDGALAHVDSSLMYIANTGVPQNDSRGSSLRIVDTGNAGGGTAGYAVYISATDATVEAMYIDDGDVLIDESLDVGGVVTVGAINNEVVVVTTGTYSVLAANTGRLHVIPDLAGGTNINLPAEAAGLNYRFVYVGAAVETHPHVIDSENNTNFMIGGVAFADTDAGAGADEIHLGFYSNGSSNSQLTITNMAAGTNVEVYCDGTNWYITGVVYSADAPAFADN